MNMIDARWVAFSAVAGTFYFLLRLIQVRIYYRRLQSSDIPIMPHSILFGHLPIIMRLTKHIPKDAHSSYPPQALCENWELLFPNEKACPPVIYADLWPVGPPMAFVTSVECMEQASEANLRKGADVEGFLFPLGHGRDILSSDGWAWKVWRTRFNPGFSLSNLMLMVPDIVDDVVRFAEKLRSHAGADGMSWGDVFQLEQHTIALTMDIIGRASLGVELDEQSAGPTPFFKALSSQLSLLVFGSGLSTLHHKLSPWRWWMLRRNGQTMNLTLRPAIERALDPNTHEYVKTVVELAMKDYCAGLPDINPTPNEDFIQSVLGNLKIFMFAGHDTTASTMCFMYYCLIQNPSATAKVRKEHDAIFGTDPASAPDLLRASPRLLNSLPYTLAVVKETLRLFPVAIIARVGQAGFFFQDSEKSHRAYPSDGFIVWDNIRANRRNEDVWKRADDFLPERWLATDESDLLYPKRLESRPFGLTPRSCIGQELALIELKLALVMTIRQLDIECAWEKWDQKERKEDSRKDSLDGLRMYMTGKGTPHPKDRMPVCVKRR